MKPVGQTPYQKRENNGTDHVPASTTMPALGPQIDAVAREYRMDSTDTNQATINEPSERNTIERLDHVVIPPRPQQRPLMNRPDEYQRPLLKALDREKKITEQIKRLDELQAAREAEAQEIKKPKPPPKEKIPLKTKSSKKVPAHANTKTKLKDKLVKAVKHSKTDADELTKIAGLLPRPIRLAWKDKPFNILQFTRDVEVTGLSLSQLLTLSPALRRVLGDSLKTLPSREQDVLLAKYPGLGVDHRNDEICAFLARTDIAKNTTHHFLATVNGHPIKPYLDGGACVNICSPEFLERANITTISNISKITIRSLGGLLSAVGEASLIPLDIAGQTVVIGCLIIKNAPCELLLGRGFLEMTQCITYWDSGLYQIQIGGKTIEIDGGRGQSPVIVHEEENVPKTLPKVKNGYRGLTQDDSDSPNNDSQSNISSASDVSSNEDSDSDSEGNYHDAFLAATQSLSEEKMELATLEELLAEEEAGNIKDVFLLMASPSLSSGPMAEPAYEVPPLAVLAAKLDPNNDPSTVTFRNNEYGFCLEAPKSRDVLTDTPCRVVPGLEEHKIMVGDLPEVQEHISEIRQLFEKHVGAFPKEGEMSRTMHADKLSAAASFTVKEDVPFPRAYSRKYSPGQISVLNDYVRKMERAGKMRKSASPVSCNPLLVEKKDGSYRVCVNFIPVNKLIRPMAWPIPDPHVEINKLQGCKWLSFWDCKDGYLQSPIEEKCRYLTAVAFPEGLWEYNVLPMGLIDSMQWYSRHMGDVFNTPELAGKLATFVDDMGTGTTTFEEHLTRIAHVLARMDEVNGSFAGNKSGFFVQRREFLGRVIGPEGISIHPQKLLKIVMWPMPKNVRELRQFVGFALFLGAHVSLMAEIADPLFGLYKFDKRPAAFIKIWNSDPQYPEAFRQLQSGLVESPVLVIFDHKRPVIASADTSDKCTGYCLAHAAELADDDNITIHTKYRPILFGSRKLSGPETRYFTTERELLGLVYTLKKNEHLLLDKTIHAFVDHRALLYLHNLQFQNARLTRWTLYLARFKMDIHHRPGKYMLDSDPLSRVPYDGPTPSYGLEDEIEDMGGLRLVAMLEIDEEPYASITAWLQGQPLTHLAPPELREIRVRALKYFILNGRLMQRTVGANPRMYVPPQERQTIIDTLHGSSTNGHLGITGTYRWASISYFWPGQFQDIKIAVQSCEACQRFQKRDSTRYRHHRIPPPPSIFLVIGMDLVGPLPMSYGMTYVLNLIDYTSSWVESIALGNIKGRTIKREVERRWFRRYGYPQVIITDNGSSLSQGEFKQECDELGIRIATASAYHPQTNGKVERYNGFMNQQFRKCLAERTLPAQEWRQELEKAAWTWNTMEKDDQGYSPFEILYGQPPRTKLDNLYQPSVTDMEDLQALNTIRQGMLAHVRETAIERINAAHEDSKQRSVLPPPREYHVGQPVLVYRADLDKQWSGKLLPRWHGPYHVAEKRAGGAYILVKRRGLHQKSYKQGRPVNHTNLKPYRVRHARR